MAYVKVGGFDNVVERCDTASKTGLNPEEYVVCIINRGLNRKTVLLCLGLHSSQGNND